MFFFLPVLLSFFTILLLQYGIYIVAFKTTLLSSVFIVLFQGIINKDVSIKFKGALKALQLVFSFR